MAMKFASARYRTMLRALDAYLKPMGFAPYVEKDLPQTLVWKQALSPSISVEGYGTVFPVRAPFSWGLQFVLVVLSSYVARAVKEVDVTRRCRKVPPTFTYNDEENVCAFDLGHVRWALEPALSDPAFKGSDDTLGQAIADFASCYERYAKPVLDRIRTPAGLAEFLSTVERTPPRRGPQKSSVYNVVSPIRTALVAHEAAWTDRALELLAEWERYCRWDADQSELGASRLRQRMCEITAVREFVASH